MPLYQLKDPSTIEAIIDVQGDAHVILDGLLTNKVIPKAEFEAKYAPLPHPG